jgi:hypothetical protein
MRLSVFLTALMVLILVAAAGCTGATSEPVAPTPSASQTPTAPVETLLPSIIPGETYLLVEYAGGWSGAWTNIDGPAVAIRGPGEQRIDVEKGRVIVASVIKMDYTEDPIKVSLYVDGQLVATNSTVEDKPITVTWKGL